MSVNAVVAGVELAAEIPLNFGLVVVDLPNGVPFFEPRDSLFGLLGPKLVRITNGATINGTVLVERLHLGVGGKLRRWIVNGRFVVCHDLLLLRIV